MMMERIEIRAVIRSGVRDGVIGISGYGKRSSRFGPSGRGKGVVHPSSYLLCLYSIIYGPCINPSYF